jgi:2-oxo-4-hydroxy-4-carboxy-5-ureidoimidazoline decarboxylase
MELWQRIDTSPLEEARTLLTTACGAHRWVDRMLIRRPFGSRDALLAVAREEWFSLAEADWREAFLHHPKIGQKSADRVASREQSGVSGAADDVLTALAEGNRAYEAKFGYIFIVCATGKSAAEMLALLRSRLPNDAATEIRIAAEEQAKITALRLQ